MWELTTDIDVGITHIVCGRYPQTYYLIYILYIDYKGYPMMRKGWALMPQERVSPEKVINGKLPPFVSALVDAR